MASLYVVNGLDGRCLSPDGFDSKKAAKVERDRLTQLGERCVVSRGLDHPNGSTRPDPVCLNQEKTSRKRKRRKTPEMPEGNW